MHCKENHSAIVSFGKIRYNIIKAVFTKEIQDQKGGK
jgi:hypothetical protein